MTHITCLPVAPASTRKATPMPGDEELYEAEEILGIREKKSRKEVLDATPQRTNYRKVYLISLVPELGKFFTFLNSTAPPPIFSLAGY